MTRHHISKPTIRRSPLAVVLLLIAVVPLALGCWEEEARDTTPAVNQAAAPLNAAGEMAAPSPPLDGASQRTTAARSERQVSLTPLGTVNPGGQGFHADVWAHNGFAYLGTWGTAGACPATGVKVIDIRDPAAPAPVGTLAAIPNTSQEDVVVRAISTSAFSGDLLAVGIQYCNRSAAGGLSLYDVSDPRRPVELAFLPTGGRGVHELDLIQQGDRALALLAVPDTEAGSGVGDFRIVDVSDPRRPVQIAAWGAKAGLGISLDGGIGCERRTYDHSARASADGRLAYLSYWDAGVIVLDITNPAGPRVVGHVSYPTTEAGTTHSVAEAAGGRYLLTADEETVYAPPPGLSFRVDTGAGPLTVRGCIARTSASIDAAGVIEAELVSVGRACMPSPAAVRGRVVVVQSDGCQLGQLVTRLTGEGALAVIAGVPGAPTTGSGGASSRIPVVLVSEEDAASIQAAVASGPVPITLPTERPWGYLRIWDISDPNNPRQAGAYQTPNSRRFPAPDDGYYTIHNPEVVGDLAVLAWWSDGVRVVDMSNPEAPREVAAYVPPPARDPQGSVFWPERAMVWGVAIAGDLVLLSDVNSGLHILRLSDEGR